MAMLMYARRDAVSLACNTGKGRTGIELSIQKTGQRCRVERPAEFGAITDSPQHRNPRAVTIDQFVVIGDVDVNRGHARMCEQCFRLLAQVAIRGAVEDEPGHS